jgi:hypothetical protein
MNVNLLREFTNGKIIHLFSFGINLHSVPSVLEPKFVYKIEQQMPEFRQQFWSR